ncbi:unnamed protein product [Aphis gossypii]|uniref:Sugar transporter n=1 Tax=Aphis gossypii TaxID=80765 RepID=A0A9P0NEN0_APHGO|nr:unnamed protein product [Aphis gossypii]
MEENAPTQPLVEVDVQKSWNISSKTPGFIAVILLFPCVISGAILGITGVSKWNLPLTYDNSTWFASLAALGAAVGCLLSQSMMNEFGPRGSVLLSHVICAVGWILTFSSSTTAYLFVGRTLTGVFVGVVTVAATEQSTECFPFRPAARPIVFNAVGVLCVYLAGLLLNYQQTAGLATVFTVVSFFLVLSFVPESPDWLESHGFSGDAEYFRHKLKFTHLTVGTRTLKSVLSTGHGSAADDEAVNQHHQPDVKSMTEDGVYRILRYSDEESPAAEDAFYSNIMQSDVLRPFLTRSVRLALQQMSGPLVLVTYAVKLVNDSGIRVINGQYVAAALALFLVAGAFVSTGIARRASASKLAAIGTLTAGVVIVVYKYFQQYGSKLVENLVPLLCLIVFSMSISAGPMPRSTAPRYKTDERVVDNTTVDVKTTLKYVGDRTLTVKTLAVKTVDCKHEVGKTVDCRHVAGEHVALAFGYAVAFAVIKCYPYAQAAYGWWVFAFFALASALNIVYGKIVYSEPKSSKQSLVEPAV